MRGAALALALAALAACGDASGPRGPRPGDLTLTLRGVRVGDEAVLLELKGPVPIETAEAVSEAHVVWTRAVPGGARVAVFGALADGPLLRFPVADVGRAEAYSATVVEVAGTGYTLRPVGGGYTGRVSR